MNRQPSRNLLLVCTAVLFGLLAGACTHIHEQPLHDVQLPQVSSKIDLPVELVVTDGFRKATWERYSMVLPVGENLVHHSELLTKNVFTRTVVRDEAEAAIRELPANRYLLEPKLAFINQTFGVTAFSEARTSIGIQWKLTNLDGETVWVETIHGEGVGTPGNAFTGTERQKERFQRALQDLFEKSQAAMLDSKVLRRLP